MEMNIGDEAKVHHISTDTIRPLTNSDSTLSRLDLTPWDLSLLPIHGIQKGLLFHKPTGDTWINDLKTSLSQVLVHFFPLAGRLATEPHEDDGTISVFIDCNNAGAEFIHAKADVSISHILDSPHIPHIVQDFFSLNGSINYNGRSEPLLSIQLTELLDGVFMGCSMNHSVADGGSFWKFINSWSEMSKSKSDKLSINKPPVLNRWFLNESDLPVRLPASKIEKAIIPTLLPPLEERIFHFSPRNIGKLKDMANQENKITGKVISSLQAVLAHAWVCITRARKMEAEEVVHYLLLMGNRGRLSSPSELPEEYFGNAVSHGVAVAKVGKLMKEGLGFAAGLLNQIVSSHSEDKICSAWKGRVKEPVVLSFGNFDYHTLMTGSSPRFNIYGNDFGWCCPVAVRSGYGNKYDGKLTIYPGVVNGSMEIEACLLPETYIALSDDSDFMEFVGIN